MLFVGEQAKETRVLSAKSESEGAAETGLAASNQILLSTNWRPGRNTFGTPLPKCGLAAFAKRFWAHVDKSSGRNACWPWTGCLNSKGYGVVGYKCTDEVKRRFLSHRVAVMLHTGQPMLPELQAMHRCDNRPCCNPRHLFTGSQSDNMQDCSRKGRLYVGGRKPTKSEQRDSSPAVALIGASAEIGPQQDVSL